MKHKKQRIILTKLWTFCLGSLCLGACSSTSIEDEGPWTEAEKAPIAFGAGLSRAAVNKNPDGSLIGMQNYAVWGWHGYQSDGTLHQSADAVQIFSNTTVDYQYGTYEGTRYWEMDKTYRFFAIHPAGMTTATEDQSPVATEVGFSPEGYMKVLGFDSSRFGNDAIDLMSAKSDPILTTQGKNPEKVNLAFQHELAKVNFIIEKANEAVKVTEVKLVHVAYKGDYRTPITDQGPLWRSLERTTEADAIFKDDGFEMDTNSKAHNIFGGDLLLIPQQLTEEAHFVMSWTYVDSKMSRTVNVPFPKAGYDEWERGKSYVYRATIPRYNSDITLDAKVQDWNNYVIIDVELDTSKGN